MSTMGAYRLVAWNKYQIILLVNCCYFGVTMKYLHMYNTDRLQLISLQDYSICI
jgi:hypothetical protein